MWLRGVQHLGNPLITLEWTRQNRVKEKQKLCTLIFSCFHDTILVLLNLMLGPQITRFIPTILYSFYSHAQVKLVTCSDKC